MLKQIFALLALLLISCQSSIDTGISQSDTVSDAVPSAASQDKIDPKITKMRSVLEHQAGPGARSYQSVSTPLVKVDERGRIECYLYVNKIDDSLLNQLKQLGAGLVEYDRDENIVQAWVPFQKIGTVASWQDVRRITAPHYGVLLNP